MSIIKNVGRVACVPKGMFDASTTYDRLDMVMYGGNGYICCVDNVTNVLPPSDTTKWKQIVDVSQISEFTVQELILINDHTIMADIITDENGMLIDCDSFTIESGDDSVNVSGDTITITDGDNIATVKSNGFKVEDEDNVYTEITSTQVNTPEVLTQTVAFSNSEISEIDGDEHFILQMRADVIDIDADEAVTINKVNVQDIISNDISNYINLETYNQNSQIILHKSGKTVKLKDGVLDTDEAWVKELNMNADGDMGGVIVFGDKRANENYVEISERDDDVLTIQAPTIICTAPSTSLGLPTINFKQKTGTTSFANNSPLKLEWEGTTLPRPTIKTRHGLSMNSDGIDYGLYLNYGNVYSSINNFMFKNLELPYTWRGETITPIFKVGDYQIKHINGQYGDIEIGEYGQWLNVYDYNVPFFMNGLNLMDRYSDGEGGYDTQQYMYFGTFDGDEGEMSSIINSQFGLNYSGKELNIWDWNESDKMTLKTVHDDETDITEHVISAPNKLTVESDDQVVISTPTTIINSDEFSVNVDSVDIDADNDIDLTTSTKVNVNGNLVITSGNTLKIGNASIDEQELNNLLNLKQETYYAKGDSNTAGVWHVTLPQITQYYEGLTIFFHVNVAGASTTTLEVNNLGACNCYRNATTAISTTYGVGCIVPLTYVLNDSNVGVWRVADYSISTPATVDAIYWYKCVLLDSSSISLAGTTPFGFLGNGNVCALLSATGSGTGKTASNIGFNLSKGIYVTATASTEVSANTMVSPTRAMESRTSADARYLCSKSSFTQYANLYYKFTKGNDGLYYFYHHEATTNNTWDGDGWFVSDTTRPTDAATLSSIESNGIYYFLVGTSTGGTNNRNLVFGQHHTLLHVENGQWKEEYI